ncbi:MAG: nucleoside phosphorylase [Bacteroidales bacterium]|nr:nucleoside phosphorylase [Bacteroidales bacterium]
MDAGNFISPSELILHPDGSIYHLKIKPEQLADTVILVGDPNRVEIISSYFDKIEFKGANREIHTHTGFLNKKRLTVMSTGMGTDNIDIVMNELDALVNIDLKSRTVKKKHKALDIIRLGTSGAIQPEIPLNAFVLSEYGLGLDGLLSFYNDRDKVVGREMTEAFIEYSKWPEEFPSPYAVPSSEKLTNKLGEGLVHGITATAPGFYGPQGRSLRLKLAYPDLMNKLEDFKFGALKIVNFEMETSALYGLGKLLGHNTLTVCVAIANRKKHEYNQNYKKAINNLIELILTRLTT